MKIQATKHGSIQVGSTVISVTEAQKMIAILARESVQAMLNAAHRQGV